MTLLCRTLLGSVAAVLLSVHSVFALTVQFEGNLSEDLQATLERSSLVVEQSELETTESNEVVSAAQADYARLLAVLYGQGYFGPTVSIKLDGREAYDISPVAAPPTVKAARIKIETGPIFEFGTARIEPIAPLTKIPDGFKTGEVATLGTLRAASGAAVSGWRDQGHAKASIGAQKITADHRSSTLNAALQVATGPKVKFGKLTVNGNREVRTERIVEIAGLPEGKVFSPEDLKKTATRLRRTGTFGSVALAEAETIGPDQSLDITAEIAEQKRRRFGFGGEVATSDGISLRTYWVNRNLWGGAERLRFDAEITGIGGTQNNEEYLLSVRYDRPATWGPDTDLFVVGRLEQEDKDDLFSRRATVGVGFKHFPSDKRTYEYGIALTAGEDRDALGDKKYLLFILPAKLTRDYRDIPLDPTTGHFLIASAIPFLAIDGADNGLRTFLDYRIYRSVGEVRPVTFAFRAQLGSVAGPSLADSPSDFLFYSGGSGTVRGHPYESLGVDLGGGSQIGGRSFLGFSAEARVKVTDTIGVVGFFDYGFVGSDPLPSESTGDYQTGAGLGVRYATGIGPIRVDVAVPVSGPDTGSNFEIYVGIGQAF